MHLSVRRKLRCLPKCFPVGTTHVVEGHVVKGHGSEGHGSKGLGTKSDGDEAGGLQVFARYVVLPSGRRINLGTGINLGASAGAPALRSRRNHGQKQATRRSPAKRQPASQVKLPRKK